MPAYVLVVGVVGVDEGGLGLGIVVVLVLVLLGLTGLKRGPCIFLYELIFGIQLYIFWHIFAHLVGNLSLGGGLAPAGDVGAVKDPENILNQSRFES